MKIEVAGRDVACDERADRVRRSERRGHGGLIANDHQLGGALCEDSLAAVVSGVGKPERRDTSERERRRAPSG